MTVNAPEDMRELEGAAPLKTLRNVRPTPEQAVVVNDDAPDYWLIAGAAGSGKTTVALLRLKFLVRYWKDRRVQLGLPGPVRVLVLTFNRTLRGYIDELARDQIQAGPEVDLEVSTFASWAQGLLGRVLLDHAPRRAKIVQLGGGFSWDAEFLLSEVDYVLGRWLPEERVTAYPAAERKGRGLAPRIDAATRVRLLNEVIAPYEAWKKEKGVVDWSDLAVALAETQRTAPYDVVVVDETQDFSANQVRAIVKHLAGDFVCTFVRDTTQRIYPNFFAWNEVGVEFGAGNERSRKLRKNYRNTAEIAAFARPLVEGVERLDDGELPDFRGCSRRGPKPTVVRGKYSAQLAWALNYVRPILRDTDQTVAFLHPKGGGWFSELRRALDDADIEWTNLTREAEWPEGDEVVALSTMHSSKGLEFDHVLILGYNAEVVEHGDGDNDSRLDTQRRLLAMAIGRARESVVLGYKPSEKSPVVSYLEPTTFDAIQA